MSLIATRVQNWRIENPELDRNMFRPCEYGALDFFIEQTNAPNSIISPNLRDRALVSIGNTVQVPVINYDENVQVSNVRSCVIADNENTSALVTLVWATYAIGFTMVPAAYSNNEISYNHDFMRKMEKTTRALADALDKGAVAALEANKTQVFKTLLNYTQTGNVGVVQYGNRVTLFFQIFGNAIFIAFFCRISEYGGLITVYPFRCRIS
jgi:hypothetical protein